MLPFLSLSYILQATRHNRDSALVTETPFNFRMLRGISC